MPRWKLTIEYHGGDFVGWQRQITGPSVQQQIEEAIHKLSGETVRLTGSGRTDAGVHALAQVAHFDMARPTPAGVVRDALNAHLRYVSISILDAEPVADDFDARFSAVRRRYCYRILNRRASEAVQRGLVWHVAAPLDADIMHEAAQIFVGKHDFSSFRAAECQAKSPIKAIEAISVVRDGDQIVTHVAARSFLHHQVRNMVGTLKLVGEGSWPPERVKSALEARSRKEGGPTAPAHGLYFVSVEY